MLRCRFLLPVIMLMLLNGCGTVYKTAEQVTAASKVYRDDYAKHTWIQAPRISHTGCGGGSRVGRTEYFLRSLVTDSGARADQLYVICHRGEWAFLDRAHDRSGRKLKVIVIDHDIDYPSIEESVAVELDDAYLRNAAVQGIDIKVAGDLGSTTVTVPPHYVQGFLVKLDEFLARR